MLHWEDSVRTGDLPATVTYSNLGIGDEGTAMLEIVHDLAPGADLYFAPGASSSAQLVGAIDWLAGQGAQVIVDDLTHYLHIAPNSRTPYFADGPADSVANAARNAAAAGVVYVTSAGNWQQQYDGLGYYGLVRCHYLHGPRPGPDQGPAAKPGRVRHRRGANQDRADSLLR